MTANKEDENRTDHDSPAATTPECPGEATSEPPSVPPNGGWHAWLQVAGAHFLFGASWGIVNTFGAYQAYYERDALLQDYSASDISWIGTFQGFLLIVGSVAVGPIFDRGYSRALIAVGIFLVVFGLMMTSLAKYYWQIFLAQGLCVGLGTACLFLPGVAIVATYFTTKRALAIGLTAAGGSIASVIYTIVFRRLQSRIGFSWATRCIGFLVLFTISFSLVVMKARVPPRKTSRKLYDSNALHSIPFLLFCAALFLSFVGVFIPFFYIVIYARTKLGVSENLSFYLLSLLNASSTFGRIVPGLLADRFGPILIQALCTFCSAILLYAWASISNLAGIVVFCILFGFFSGAVVSLSSSVVAELVPNLENVGTWMGMSFPFCGLGILIGNPIAGALVDIPESNFTQASVFGGSMVMAAAAALGVAQASKEQYFKKITRSTGV